MKATRRFRLKKRARTYKKTRTHKKVRTTKKTRSNKRYRKRKTMRGGDECADIKRKLLLCRMKNGHSLDVCTELHDLNEECKNPKSNTDSARHSENIYEEPVPLPKTLNNPFF
jgi:hypothetical protein